MSTPPEIRLPRLSCQSTYLKNELKLPVDVCVPLRPGNPLVIVSVLTGIRKPIEACWSRKVFSKPKISL